MLGQQLLLGPAIRQLPGVPDHDLVFINADLDRNAAGIVLVDNSVEQRLAYGPPRKQETLDALDTLIVDISFEVFAVQKLERFFDLGRQIAKPLASGNPRLQVAG